VDGCRHFYHIWQAGVTLQRRGEAMPPAAAMRPRIAATGCPPPRRRMIAQSAG